MIFPFEEEKIITEGIIFLAYLMICIGLASTHPLHMKKMKFWKKVALCGGILVLTVFVQGVLYLTGWDIMLILTRLSVTAYLPAIVIISIAAHFQVYEVASVGAIGYLSIFILKMIKKILYIYVFVSSRVYSISKEFLCYAVLMIFSALLVWFAYQFLREKFWVYIGKNTKNWLFILFPVCMQFLQYSYFFRNSQVVLGGLLIQLFVSFSILLIILCVLSSQVAVEQMKESEEAVKLSLDMQRQEYENICKKIEAGRAYRHDMRHHLSTMEKLVRQGDVGSVLHYIQEMGGCISETEWNRYCENPILNAVFSSCVSYAKSVRCTVETDLSIPKEIPYNEIDICMILANTIENAVHACRKIPVEQERLIHVKVKLIKDHKLLIAVKNPCVSSISFDKDGLPDVVLADGHGIGLKSVKSIVDKYSGIFQCSCSGGSFCFQTMLFDGNDIGAVVRKKPTLYKKIRTKIVNSFIAAGLMCLIILSSSSLESQGNETVSAKDISGKKDSQSENFRWGDTAFHAENPVLDKEELWSKENVDVLEESKEVSASIESLPEEIISSADNTAKKTDTPPKDSSDTVPESSPDSAPQNSSNPVPADSKDQKAELEEQSDKKKKKEAIDRVTREGITVEEIIEEDTEHSDSEETQSTQSDEIVTVVDELNLQIAEYIDRIRQKFYWYVRRKYEGYVGADTNYKILRNDEDLFMIRLDSAINVGGSVNYSRCFLLDKRVNKILEIGDLFVSRCDYIGMISEEIIRQMKERVAQGKRYYYVEGSIYSEKDWFRRIKTDQNFYLNQKNEIVVVFDEYEVASGAAGCPEFVIPSKVVENILKEKYCY